MIRHRYIGGRQVSPVGIGGARWSLAPVPDAERARATLHAALDAGVTLVDTALAYTPPPGPGADPFRSHNEELIASCLADHPRGASVTVATKGGHYRAADGFVVDARPEALRRHCQASLAALGVDRIDLYLLHWPDPRVPFEESVATLAALRAEGLVDMVGVCNVSLDQLRTACAVTRIDAVQNHFSPIDRHDRPVLDFCAGHGIAYLSYSPFGGPAGARSLGARLPALAEIASAHQVSVHEVAVAWLLARSPVLIPLVGAGNPRNIATAVRGARLTLTAAQLRALDAAAEPATPQA